MIQYPVVKIYIRIYRPAFSPASLSMHDLQSAVLIGNHLLPPAAYAGYLARCNIVLPADVPFPKIKCLLVSPAIVIQSHIKWHANRPYNIPFPFAQLVIRGLVCAQRFA